MFGNNTERRILPTKTHVGQPKATATPKPKETKFIGCYDTQTVILAFLLPTMAHELGATTLQLAFVNTSWMEVMDNLLSGFRSVPIPRAMQERRPVIEAVPQQKVSSSCLSIREKGLVKTAFIPLAERPMYDPIPLSGDRFCIVTKNKCVMYGLEGSLLASHDVLGPKITANPLYYEVAPLDKRTNNHIIQPSLLLYCAGSELCAWPIPPSSNSDLMAPSKLLLGSMGKQIVPLSETRRDLDAVGTESDRHAQFLVLGDDRIVLVGSVSPGLTKDAEVLGDFSSLTPIGYNVFVATTDAGGYRVYAIKKEMYQTEAGKSESRYVIEQKFEEVNRHDGAMWTASLEDNQFMVVKRYPPMSEYGMHVSVRKYDPGSGVCDRLYQKNFEFFPTEVTSFGPNKAVLHGASGKIRVVNFLPPVGKTPGKLQKVTYSHPEYRDNPIAMTQTGLFVRTKESLCFVSPKEGGAVKEGPDVKGRVKLGVSDCTHLAAVGGNTALVYMETPDQQGIQVVRLQV